MAARDDRDHGGGSDGDRALRGFEIVGFLRRGGQRVA
jgi:hypothetical protein